MKRILTLILILCFASCWLTGCKPGDDALAEGKELKTIGDDGGEVPAIMEKEFRLLDLITGNYSGEMISDIEFGSHNNTADENSVVNNWNLGMGDVLFFRGERMGENAIVPNPDGNYWNGACFIFSEHVGDQNWCYMPIWTSKGWQIYKRNPGRVGNKYCIVAHWDYTGGSGDPIGDIYQLMENAKKSQLRLGDISKAAVNQGIFITMSGLIHQYYKNLNIDLSDASSDYIQLEDFIEKTDASGDGYYRSLNSYFTVRDVSINSAVSYYADEGSWYPLGCEKVW